MNGPRLLIFTAIISSCSSLASADLVLDLATGGPTNVVSGATVFVDLVLRDTDDSHFGPGLGIGLSFGGGKIIQSGGVAGAVSAGAPALGADFATSLMAPALQVPGIASAQSAAALPLSPAGIATGTAHIATFAVTITGLVGDTATISADTFGFNSLGNPVNGNSTFPGLPVSLDPVLTSFAATPSNFGSVTFTVTAVPEPSTWAFCGLGAAGLVWYRRRQTARRSACAV